MSVHAKMQHFYKNQVSVFEICILWHAAQTLPGCKCNLPDIKAAFAKTVNSELKQDSLKLLNSFRWVKPLARKGYKSDLKIEDLYKWSSEDDASNLANQLEGQEL
jgi:hypothetical protein